MKSHKIAVVGIGKIATDQHLPVIAGNREFALAGVVSQRGIEVEGVPTFRTQAELFAAIPDLDAVAICTPPGVRHAHVREALAAGVAVMMEKPPTPTISEFDDLVAFAENKNLVLFATWHSQFNPAVEFLKNMLRNDPVKSLRIDWRESVRKWHPGQDWVWEPGGFGVCDPGINALSILTEIMPEPVFVESAVLEFPENRQTPVGVEIKFKLATANDVPISAGFNWLEESGEVWEFSIETQSGKKLKLEVGGARLTVDGREIIHTNREEYERIYVLFDELLKTGKSDVDGAPLRLVADAFLIGKRVIVAPFEW